MYMYHQSIQLYTYMYMSVSIYPSIYPVLQIYMYIFSATLHSEMNQKLIPYTEDDLALMYLNPQLAANQEFVENFIRVSIIIYMYICIG